MGRYQRGQVCRILICILNIVSDRFFPLICKINIWSDIMHLTWSQIFMVERGWLENSHKPQDRALEKVNQFKFK